MALILIVIEVGYQPRAVLDILPLSSHSFARMQDRTAGVDQIGYFAAGLGARVRVPCAWR